MKSPPIPYVSVTMEIGENLHMLILNPDCVKKSI